MGAVARVDNLKVLTPACEGKVNITTNESGEVQISFDQLSVARGDPKPFVRCRIGGSIVIPQGYEMASDVPVEALVKGNLDQAGDQIAGKLRVRIADKSVSDFEFVRQSDVTGNYPTQQLAMEKSLMLQVFMPVFDACEEERTWSLNVQLEGMINYRLDQSSGVSAVLQAVRLAPIALSDEACQNKGGTK